MATITIDRSVNVDDAYAMSGAVCFVSLASGSASYQTNATGIAGWTSQAAISVSSSWQSVCYGNNLIVAVSSTVGTIAATSPTGVTATWITRTLPISASWYQVAYGAGVFCALTSGLGSATNAAATSVDGAIWTSCNMSVAGNWQAMCFGNGKFVALSNSSTDIAYSSDGITWNAATTTELSAQAWSSVVWGGDKYVAVATGTDQGAYSTDGITWHPVTMPSSSNWKSITYGNGTYVAVSNTTGTIAAYSSNGTAWTSCTLPNSRDWIGVAFGNNLFAAIASASTTGGAYSYDGISWVATATTSLTTTCITYTPITWNSADTLVITNNATVTVNASQNKFWSAITLTNGKLRIENNSTTTGIRFTMGRSSGATASSITPGSGIGDIEIAGNWIQLGTGDGTSSQELTAPFTDYISCLWVETAAASGVYEIWLNATGSYGDTTPLLTEGLSAVGSGARGKFFIQQANSGPYGPLKLNGTLGSRGQKLLTLTSTTGLYPGAQVFGPGLTNAVVNKIDSPTQIEVNVATTTEVSPDWAGVAYGSSTYVAISSTYSNIAATSSDGITWTQRTLPFIADWTSICYAATAGGGSPLFVAVASHGAYGVAYCATSPDGITWTQRAMPSLQNWTSVASSGTTFVAVGQTSANAVTTAGAYSADGITWVANVMSSQIWWAVAYGGGRYVAVGAGTVSNYDADGAGTWSIGATLTSATYRGLCYNGTIWVAVSGSSTGSQWKADPTTGAFTAGGSLGASTARGIAWDGTNFVVVFTTNATRTARSTNAVAWTATTLTLTKIGSWNAIVANGTTLITISSSSLLRSRVMTSTDSGTTWTVQDGIPTDVTLVCFNPYVSQLTGVVEFGDGVNGNKVPTGAKVRCPNIMFTSATPANLHTSSRLLGANMVMSNAGSLSASICLFDESYNTLTQSEAISLTYCGFTIPPLITECYGVTLNSIGFGLEPSRRYFQFSATLASSGWFGRDSRYGSGSANAWNYINGATVNDLNIVVCQPHTISGTGGGSVASPNSALYVTYTDSSTWTNLRFYGLNVGRSSQSAMSCTTLFNNNTITGLESYGLGAIYLGTSSGNTVTNITYSEDMFNGMKSFVSAARIGNDPIAGGKLANNTKYYIKTRTFKDWSDRTMYCEGRVVSATPFLGDKFFPQSISAYNSATRTVTLTWVRRDPTSAVVAYTVFRGTSSGFIRNSTSRLFYSPTSTVVTYANGFVASFTALSDRTLTFAQAGRTITATAKTGYSFITDGFVAGANVVVSGTTNNNGTYMILSVAANVITLTANHTNLVNEGPLNSTATLSGHVPDNSSTYYYRLLKCDSTLTLTTNCSGTSGLTDLTTSSNFNTGLGTIINCEGTAGSNKIRIPVGSTTNFYAGNVTVGLQLTATGVGTGATVVSIDTPWQITVSAVNSSTFTATTISLGLTAGMYVYGPGVAWPTKIVSINSATSLTVDTAFIATFSNQTVNFMYGSESSEIEVYVNGATTPAFNYLQYPDDFSNAIWVKTNLTVTVDQRLSPTQVPFSTATVTGVADRFWSIGPSARAVQTITNLKIGDSYTFSVYVLSDANAYFIAAGEISVNTTVTTTQSFTATGVWQRVSTTFTATATSHTFTIQINTEGSYFFVAGANLTPGATLLPPVTNTIVKLSTSAATTRIFTFAGLGTVNTITASGTSAGSFVTDGFVAGDSIIVAGTASNDGQYVLTIVSATVLTITPAQPLVNETAPAGTTITGSVLAAAAQELTLAAAWNRSLGGNTTNQGIEFTLATIPANAHYTEIYLGTASDFTPTDYNRVAYASMVASPNIVSLGNSESNLVSNVTQLGTGGFSGNLVYLTGSSSNNFQDFAVDINYAAAASIVNVSALSNNNVFDDFTVLNWRNYVSSSPFTLLNNASGVTLQNISFNDYDIPFYNSATNSALNVVMKGVTGGHAEPITTATIFPLGSAVDGVGVAFTAVYDTLFHELFHSATTGALALRFNASSSDTPPYTVVSGSPTFSSTGKLYTRTAGDSIEFVWPHRIYSFSSFRDIPIKLNTFDLGQPTTTNPDSAFAVLTEYAIDTGSGYGAYKTATTTNLISESISTTTGFYIKIRLTVRPGMMFSTQTNAFVVGEVIEGTTSGATATVKEIYKLSTTTGTIILEDAITGTFLPGELIRRASDDQTRATNVVTNGQFALFPSYNSYIDGLDIYTNSVGPGDYAGQTTSIVLTNVVIGSTYYVYKTSDLSLLGLGTATSSTVTITGVPYVADFGITVRVRKSSAQPKYVPLVTQATVKSSGVDVYIGQSLDTIAI